MASSAASPSSSSALVLGLLVVRGVGGFFPTSCATTPLMRRPTLVRAARRMVPESETQSEEAMLVLQRVSDFLVEGDDAAALRTVSQGVGTLLGCDALPTLAESFDARTRHLALSYVEEFAEKASELETKRKRLLLSLVEEIKASGSSPDVIDAAFLKRREEALELDLLDHVETELSKVDEEGPVKNFLEAIRDRLAAELVRSFEEDFFGDQKNDIEAIRDVLAEPTDQRRLALLRHKLHEFQVDFDHEEAALRAEAWYQILSDTTQMQQHRNKPDEELERSLSLLLRELEQRNNEYAAAQKIAVRDGTAAPTGGAPSQS